MNSQGHILCVHGRSRLNTRVEFFWYKINLLISITLYNDSKDARTADYLRYRLLDDDPRYRPIQKLSLTETYKAGVQKLFFIFFSSRFDQVGGGPICKINCL